MAFSSLRRPSSPGRKPDSSHRLHVDGRHGVHQIVWRPGVLDQVRSFSGESYLSRGGTGNEVGGVFFGQRLGELLHVMAWRPIFRAPGASSRFELKAEEVKHLRRLLVNIRADSTLRGMQVVGWFRSCTKGEPVLDKSDVEFHETYFPEPASFVLILKPSHQRPALTSLFMRNLELELECGVPIASITLPPGPVPVTETPGGKLSRPEVFIDRNPQPTPAQLPWKRIGAMCGLALTLVLLTVLVLQWSFFQNEKAQNATSLGLKIELDKNFLKASWNSSTQSLQSAKSGSIQLGAVKVALSPDELKQGFIRLPLKEGSKGDLDVRLTVGLLEENSHIIANAQ